MSNNATLISMLTIGIDEVGRGCWAGPLVAGAVMLTEPLLGLKDSKKLSKLQRERLDKAIRAHTGTLGLGWVWPAEIDAHGISWAVRTAMERAVAALPENYDEIIIDGSINYFPSNAKAKAVIKADDSVPAVSAASIVAKVARDAYMAQQDTRYPGYGFAQHVGYGTQQHSTALAVLGVTDIHRRSYKPIARLLTP
jgi:ribonuclease HII